MGKMLSSLDDRLTAFIAEQKIFFTATAPNDGRVNLSPKGIDTFRCLDHHTVAYLDLTGSGNEASAHLIENGRMTIMFCAFDGAPLILRLYGSGRVVRPRDAEWDELLAKFNPLPGQRQIVVLNVESVQTSCGFAVPCFDYTGQRSLLLDWSEKKAATGSKPTGARKIKPALTDCRQNSSPGRTGPFFLAATRSHSFTS